MLIANLKISFEQKEYVIKELFPITHKVMALLNALIEVY